MTSAENIVYSVNADVNDDARAPLFNQTNQTSFFVSLKQKQTGCTCRSLGILIAVLTAVSLVGVGVFIGFKEKLTLPDYTYRKI